MSNRQKLKQYCNILHYVEVQDPELADAFKDQCMQSTMNPRRGSAGMTFLMPGKKLSEKIVLAVYNDPDNGTKMLRSLLIPDYLPSGSDWKNNDVGSLNGVKYEIESANSSSVSIKGGAKLKKLPITMNRYENDNRPMACIYSIESGELPLSGESYSPPSADSRNKTGSGQNRYRKKGGYYGGGDGRSRLSIFGKIMSDFNTCLNNDKCKSDDPTLRAAVSLLNYLYINDNEVFSAVIPLVDHSPFVTLVILMEPWKESDHMINDNAILSWGGNDLYDNALFEWGRYLDNFPSSEGSTWCKETSSNQTTLLKSIDLVRTRIIAPENLDKRSTPENVLKVYQKLLENNSIGDAQNALPLDTIKMLGTPLRKLHQDELRYILNKEILELYSERGGDLNQTLGSIKFSSPGNDYPRELRIVNKIISVAPNPEFDTLLRFVNSPAFMYVLNSNESFRSQYTNDGSDSALEPRDSYTYWNFNKVVREKMKTRLVNSDLNSSVAEKSNKMRNQLNEIFGNLQAAQEAQAAQAAQAAKAEQAVREAQAAQAALEAQAAQARQVTQAAQAEKEAQAAQAAREAQAEQAMY